MELVKHYMKKLKTILKYNKIFFILGIIVFIYTFIFTTFIKCESKYKENETFIEGKVLNYSFTKEKISLTIAGKEKIIVSYYFKNQEDQKNILNQIHLGDKISLKGQFIKPKTLLTSFSAKNITTLVADDGYEHVNKKKIKNEYFKRKK